MGSWHLSAFSTRCTSRNDHRLRKQAAAAADGVESAAAAVVEAAVVEHVAAAAQSAVADVAVKSSGVVD